MTTVSNYARNFLMDYIFRGAGTLPDPWYYCLCTSAITKNLTGSQITETLYSNYARLPIGVGTSYYSDIAINKPGTTGQEALITNTAKITFPAVGASVGLSIGYWAICDASIYGNLWFFGSLSSGSGIPTTLKSPQFGIGDFILRFSEVL